MSASRPVSARSALSSEEDMPRTRAKTAPKKATTPNTRKRTAAATTKKPAASAKGSKAKTTKKTTKPASSRPTWKDIIRECIVDNKDDVRVGVSRSTIKKFAEERYGVEMNPLNLFQLGRAIASGTETGIFVLPKGPSGKVKLAPKTGKPIAAKENAKPLSKTATTKKPPAASKTTAPTKKVLANKSRAKSPPKKPSSASKRNSAKKAVTGGPAVRAAKKTGRKVN